MVQFDSPTSFPIPVCASWSGWGSQPCCWLWWGPHIQQANPAWKGHLLHHPSLEKGRKKGTLVENLHSYLFGLFKSQIHDSAFTFYESGNSKVLFYFFSLGLVGRLWSHLLLGKSATGKELFLPHICKQEQHPSSLNPLFLAVSVFFGQLQPSVKVSGTSKSIK